MRSDEHRHAVVHLQRRRPCVEGAAPSAAVGWATPFRSYRRRRRGALTPSRSEVRFPGPRSSLERQVLGNVLESADLLDESRRETARPVVVAVAHAEKRGAIDRGVGADEAVAATAKARHPPLLAAALGKLGEV